MNILALDTATRTGWALHTEPSGQVLSGVADSGIRTAATKTKAADFPGLRFRLFRDWLLTMITDYKVDLIVYEAVVGGRHAGGKTSLIQKGFEALVLEAATHRRGWADHTSVWSFAPATIKKWATGSGVLTHESKAQLVASARRAFKDQKFIKHNPTKSQPWAWDDNQCDALWLLSLARAVEPVAFEDMGLLAHEATPQQLTAFANLVVNRKWSHAKKR
jgi:hypothetical protein